MQNIKERYNKRFLKTRVVFIVDVMSSLIASMAVVLLVSMLVPEHDFGTGNIMWWLGFACVASVISFRVGRVYRAIIRYSTLRELGRLSLVVIGKELLLYILMVLFSTYRPGSGIVFAMVVMDFFVTLGAMMMVRVLMVVAYDRIKSSYRAEKQSRNVLVYGTSDKAASTVSRLRNSQHYQVVGFITYGQERIGHQLAGRTVYYFENKEDVIRLKNTVDIDGILFSYTADARAEQNRLINYCHDAGLKTYIIPGIDEMTEGKAVNNYIRKIKIEDLLGRPEIKISMDEIIANFKDKVVMVTGAAGSIGSELCRQLAGFGVRRLVLFDNAETPLHNIRLDLEDKFPNLDFVPVVGDVRNPRRLDTVFHRYAPQIVFHAAAYKHVPLMEENPCEAVMVNVMGTRQVADKCVEYNVEKMVMVSTDKAVNPTNVMGCTKRLAEIYVQSLGLALESGERKGSTTFVTTRFGNVLGSNGSVIPRFREQLEHGGPITVTHPEINRFFMTIPEACRLVMEAATFSTGTQIFVFDMGESVKIVTLAERMIHLAGLEVGRDIQIEFTGLRPGEKLYEEVLATKENTLPTSHKRIFVAKAREYSYAGAVRGIDSLIEYANTGEIMDTVRCMKQIVPEFKSKNSTFEQLDNELQKN